MATAPQPPEDDLERDLHTEHQILNMGPSHPATHGTVKFVVELDGETIVDLDVQVGYLHRGFEKECENGSWYQAIPYTDRLAYTSAILCNVGFCMAVEKLLELETPERCQWLRVLSGEIARVSDHLTRCGAAALELQAMTPFLYGIEARELTYDLMELLCGARVTANYIRIGGVKHDMPQGFPEAARELIPKIRGLISDYDAVVTQNRIFVDRDPQDSRPDQRLRRRGHPEPHLRRSSQGYRGDLEEGLHRLRGHRPDPALCGCALRHPQGPAVPRLRPGRLRRSHW
jgi:NADH-quinone oxidoreductase subunit D